MAQAIPVGDVPEFLDVFAAAEALLGGCQLHMSVAGLPVFLCLPTITLSNEASVVVNFALESPFATCLYARHPNTHFPSVPER